MKNVILAIDNEDNALGIFFGLCLADLEQYYNSISITPTILRSRQLNDPAIQLVTSQHRSFVFGAYSHGDYSSLVEAASNPYISIALNGTSFKNSFFYTCSCYTGQELGRDLIPAGCLCYIGYDKAFSVWTYNYPPFVDCANYGLKLFFEGKRTDEIVGLMKARYTEHIDNYNNDIIGAVVLTSNREALKMHGPPISIDALH